MLRAFSIDRLTRHSTHVFPAAGPDVGEGADAGGPHHLAEREADGAAGRGAQGQPQLLLRPQLRRLHHHLHSGTGTNR